MASAAALYMASLTILGVCLGRTILKEQITTLATLALVICLCGITFILLGLTKTVTMEASELHDQLNAVNTSTAVHNQSFLFQTTGSNHRENHNSDNPSEKQRNIHTGTINELIMGVAGCLICGVAEAISIVSLKYIQDDIREVHIITFWMGVSGLVITAVAIVAFELDALNYPCDIPKALYLVGQAFAVACGQCFYVLAMEKTSAYLLSIILNGQIPTNMLFQYIIVKNFQPISGGLYDIIGAFIVTIGLVLPPIIDLCKQKGDQEIEPVLTAPLLDYQEGVVSEFLRVMPGDVKVIIGQSRPSTKCCNIPY